MTKHDHQLDRWPANPNSIKSITSNQHFQIRSCSGAESRQQLAPALPIQSLWSQLGEWMKRSTPSIKNKQTWCTVMSSNQSDAEAGDQEKDPEVIRSLHLEPFQSSFRAVLFLALLLPNSGWISTIMIIIIIIWDQIRGSLGAISFGFHRSDFHL